MKPLKLKIKGLNSFIEEQVIDFEKLTMRGLFGIFGPTGSGKSTILDGITLALYGDISRKSNNFINTNCNSMNVSFEFQITNTKIKKYRVQREFKRDKKTNNPKSSKCKVVDITNEDIVLADKVRDVTEKCTEIIGLSLEDFTRTVVLPQGKFNEFLKLEGKNRRDMLERLFNLEIYGENISRKLAFEITKVISEENILEGELKGYGDINVENLNIIKKEYEEIKELYIKVLNEYTIFEKDYKTSTEIYNLQKELEIYVVKEEELAKKESVINDYKDRIAIYESINRVKQTVITLEKIKEDFLASVQKEKEISKNVDIILNNKKIIEEKYEKIKTNKEKELPLLRIKEEKIKEAIKEKIQLLKIKDNISELEAFKDKLTKDKNDKYLLLKEITEKYNGNLLILKEKEELVEKYHIDEMEKKYIQEGIFLIEKLGVIKRNLKNKEKRKEDINEEIIKNKGLLKEYEFEYKSINEKYELELLKKENISLKKPLEQDVILKIQNEININKEKGLKVIKLIEEINKRSKLTKEISNKLANLKEEYDNLNSNILDIENILKKLEEENLVNILKKNIAENTSCPVCGNTVHNISSINLETQKNINENKFELEILYKKQKEIEKEITILNTNFKEHNYQMEISNKELIEIGKAKTLDDILEEEKLFEEELKNNNLYLAEMKTIENNLAKYKEEWYIFKGNVNNINVKINEGTKIYKELLDEIQEINKETKDINEKIEKLLLKANTKDLKKRNDEILKMEFLRNNLIKEIKILREELDKTNKNKESLNEEISKLTSRLDVGDSMIEEKKKQYKEKEDFIYSKTNNINKDPDELLNEVIIQIEDIETKYKNITEEKEENFNSYQLENEMLIKTKSAMQELQNRLTEQKNILSTELKKENLPSIEYVKENISKVYDLDSLKKETEEHDKESSNIKALITNINIKLNSRSITHEEFNKLSLKKIELEKEIEDINKEKIKKEEQYKIIKEKILELKLILEKKEKIEHRKALLRDLEKLFRGKRFVEYIAKDRLSYISRDASKRLLDITNGVYGLEVDEESKFIIRDYKNGGVKRDTSTLSGGETFLASLALSLSLSAEIQLKGTAPLELFFLDEGFGTLDDDLLEVVMNSLERIHNDKLKIGIISHVESIRSRIPVKLIITPAESGKGGSKTQIEKS